MARIRTIKPDFWTDERTGPLSLLAKCLFVGMLNLSDDCGVLRCSPEEWRVKLFPYQADITPSVIAGALREIWESELVDVFGISNKPSYTYVFIRNFCKNQVVNRPSLPLLPEWRKNETPRMYAERNELLLHLFNQEEPPPPLTLIDHSVSAV